MKSEQFLGIPGIERLRPKEGRSCGCRCWRQAGRGRAGAEGLAASLAPLFPPSLAGRRSIPGIPRNCYEFLRISKVLKCFLLGFCGPRNC